MAGQMAILMQGHVSKADSFGLASKLSSSLFSRSSHGCQLLGPRFHLSFLGGTSNLSRSRPRARKQGGMSMVPRPQKVLAVHMRGIPVANDPVILRRMVASLTGGFVGAELANFVKEVTLLAARKDLKPHQARSIHEDKDPLVSRKRFSNGLRDVSIPDIRGGVVALGKFDALHIGHRALTERAASMGRPILLSFSGMADILGWEPRLPVAALCDRKRVMEIWAERFGVVPREFSLEFVKVRNLSPREFVQKLSKGLKIKGVVAGANYRFGYKAAGDATDLVRLCHEFGLQCFIVDPVMDKDEEVSSMNGEFLGSSREKGQISSTRIRKALALGNMERVTNLLGRRHRLVLKVDNCILDKNRILAPVRNALNQYPAEGSYTCALVATGEQLPSADDEADQRDSENNKGDHVFGPVEVRIGPAWIEIFLGDPDARAVLQRTLLALEF